MGLRKIYWPTLYQIVKRVCDYYHRYQDSLPNDLPGSVATAMAALELACTALRQYDLEHKRGVVAAPESDED